jgi:glucose/arabinose dehydrogenase
MLDKRSNETKHPLLKLCIVSLWTSTKKASTGCEIYVLALAHMDELRAMPTSLPASLKLSVHSGSAGREEGLDFITLAFGVYSLNGQLLWLIFPDRMNVPQEMRYRLGAFLSVTALWLLLVCAEGHSAPRVPWTTSRVVGSPNPPAPLRVENMFPKLKFDAPVEAGAMPGSDLIFVLEQRGKLYSFPARIDSDRANLVFDFSAHQPFDSAYSFAFHPKFSENHFVFVCYVEPGGRTNGSYVSRFTLQPSTPPAIDPESERVILRWLSGGHNGGKLAFGNDGFLYISTGDGANPDPPDFPYKTGQDISDLLSSILRIDVDHAEGTNTYSIPGNNPFVTTSGARPEVYAFGLRNPWRFSFDRATGDLWAGDVGWEQWEMIYRIKSGGNYGWSIVEGPNTHVRTDVQPGPGPIQTPLIALPTARPRALPVA